MLETFGSVHTQFYYEKSPERKSGAKLDAHVCWTQMTSFLCQMNIFAKESEIQTISSFESHILFFCNSIAKFQLFIFHSWCANVWTGSDKTKWISILCRRVVKFIYAKMKEIVFSFSNQTTQCKLILSKFQEIISQITVFVIEIYFPLRSNLQSIYVVATAFSPHQLNYCYFVSLCVWMSVSFRMPGHICHMAAIFVYIFPASVSWFSLCQISWTVFMNENHECVPWRTASADHTIFKSKSHVFSLFRIVVNSMIKQILVLSRIELSRKMKIWFAAQFPWINLDFLGLSSDWLGCVGPPN